jgi:GABA(A) receptor-associated protein
MNFKTTNSISSRLAESTRIRQKFPDRVPIICERHANSSLPEIKKHKFLVPHDMRTAHFLIIIRQKMQLDPAVAIILYVGNSIPSPETFINNLYENYGDEDGFLYITYTGENTFG